MHIFLRKSESCGRPTYIMGENFCLVAGRTNFGFIAVELHGAWFIKDLNRYITIFSSDFLGI